MKKLLQKRPMLLLCALLLFSLGCMGVLAVAEPSKNAGSTAETEMMTEGAVPLSDGMEKDLISTATESNARKVTLNPGNGGSLAGNAEILVNKETGEILSELPTPTRKGWTFDGWYTEPIKEVYLSGGDAEADGGSYTLVSEREVIIKLREQVKGTKWAELPDAQLLQKHHSWLIDDTAGKLVTKDQKLEGTVSTLYAKYEPKTVHVKWNNNGWQGSTGALRSSGEYGGYVYTWDQTGDQWGDRVFAGWSFTRDGDVAIENGCVYKLGGEHLDFTDTDTINLYAVWTGGEGRDVKEVEVSIYTDSTHRALHLREGWRYFIEYKLLPEDAFDDPVEWSIDPPGAGYFEKQGTKNRMLAVIYNQKADVTSVTVTVTAANGVTGSVEIPLKHSWNRNYTYHPNCQHDGYAVDECTVCGIRNQPKFSKTDHIYTRLTVPATCTEPEYTDNICTICGHKEKTVTGPALGHTWGEITTVQSCGGAVETKTCTVCGFTQTDVDVNDAKHQWESVMTVDKAPTCSEAGSRSYHCVVCGLTKDSETIPANPDLHRWTGWTTKSAAQVGIMGMESRRCWTCGVVESHDIEALLPEAESLATGSTSGSGSSSSSGSSGGSSGGGYSGGGSGGGGGGGSRGGGGGGGSSSAKAGGPAAAAAPLPIVPTEEIREALPQYVEVGSWNQAADGSWMCTDSSGQPYTNRWAAIYNPYSNTAAADAYDWFRFDATGHLITGWYTDPADGNTYYMNPNSDGTQGKMMTGWVVIDGKEYYFNASSDGQRGRMYKNETTPDGHFVGPDGAKIR